MTLCNLYPCSIGNSVLLRSFVIKLSPLPCVQVASPDIQIVGQTGRQIDRQIDRQIYRYLEIDRQIFNTLRPLQMGGSTWGEVDILLSGALFHKSIYTKNWNGIMLIVHFFHLTFQIPMYLLIYLTISYKPQANSGCNAISHQDLLF